MSILLFLKVLRALSSRSHEASILPSFHFTLELCCGLPFVESAESEKSGQEAIRFPQLRGPDVQAKWCLSEGCSKTLLSSRVLKLLKAFCSTSSARLNSVSVPPAQIRFSFLQLCTWRGKHRETGKVVLRCQGEGAWLFSERRITRATWRCAIAPEGSAPKYRAAPCATPP